MSRVATYCHVLPHVVTCYRYDDEEEQVCQYQRIFLEDIERLEIGKTSSPSCSCPNRNNSAISVISENNFFRNKDIERSSLVSVYKY